MCGRPSIQGFHADSRLEILRSSRQRLQLLMRRGVIVQFVQPLALPSCIHADGGKPARSVEVQIRVQLCRIELVQRFGMLGGYVAIADELANDGPVFPFRALSEDVMFTLSRTRLTVAAAPVVGVVLAAASPAFGELHHHHSHHFGDGVVDVLRTVVDMKTQYQEGKLMQYRFQYRLQILHVDPRRASRTRGEAAPVSLSRIRLTIVLRQWSCHCVTVSTALM